MFLKKKKRKIRILSPPPSFSIISGHPQWNPASPRGDREEQPLLHSSMWDSRAGPTKLCDGTAAVWLAKFW